KKHLVSQLRKLIPQNLSRRLSAVPAIGYKNIVLCLLFHRLPPLLFLTIIVTDSREIEQTLSQIPGQNLPAKEASCRCSGAEKGTEGEMILPALLPRKQKP